MEFTHRFQIIVHDETLGQYMKHVVDDPRTVAARKQ